MFFRRTKTILASFALVVVLSGCAWSADLVAPFSDVRWKEGKVFTFGNVLKEGTYSQEDIRTFWFNDRVVFEGAGNVAKAILEAGKNPGLGVRSLHARGITGKGVRVAIIDQPKPKTHSEYKDKIVDYYNPAGDVYEMHGPAVASLLVGTECGTAPGAKLYYAAIATWHQDTAYFADSLRWIIEQNKGLPVGDKIRVVSVSAAPSGQGTPYTKNTEQWDIAVAEAKAAEILVLDCRMNKETGFMQIGYYDLNAPDDLSRFTPGSPKGWVPEPNANIIYAPAGCRTQAEEYAANENHWQYTGDGGLSWTIPYVAGVLALGWQVDPTLTNDEIVAILRKTAYVTKAGYRVVNPVAFINAIENPQSDPPIQPGPAPTENSGGGGGCNSGGFILPILTIASLLAHRRYTNIK